MSAVRAREGGRHESALLPHIHQHLLTHTGRKIGITQQITTCTKEKTQTYIAFVALNIVFNFFVSEPGVASSDATNMECQITREGSEVVINGRKWWSSGK